MNEAKNPEDRHGLATAQKWLGETYTQRGWYKKAEAKLKEAASICEGLVRDHSEVPTYLQSHGKVHIALGILHANMHLPEQAEVAGQHALQLFERLAKEHPD